MYSLIYVGSFRSHLATKLLYVNSGEAVTDFTASNATLAPVTQNGTEKYVKATSNGTVARTGVFPVGGMFSVVAGERYKIRMKGYRTGTSAANLLIKAGGNDLSWPGVAVPLNAATESWIEQIVTIPAGATTLEAGAVWATVTSGEVLYINEFEIIKLETTTPEYQYNLKDHLGNVRLTFTTKQETESATATLETANANAESGKFINYTEAIKVNHAIWDHTNSGATTYATRLTGANTNAVYGLAKSLSVMPGDVVNMQVYAKYLDTNNANWTTALNNFITSIANGTAPVGTLVDGGAAGSLGAGASPISPINHAAETGTPPKAYLNYIVFNKDMTTVLNSGFSRITTNSREYGQDCTHDLLSLTYTVKEPGYIYIYLSNENATAVEVYFDDFKVDHIKSPVLQMDDYYAFGLAFNSYSRENSTPQNYKYNGKEEQDELGINWLDYGARMYMGDIGRWTAVDPKAQLLEMSSPYVYSLNNPINFVDKDGELPIFINGKTMSSSERGDASYWDYQLLRTIASSGIPNPGGEIHFVDGNRGYAYSGRTREWEPSTDNPELPIYRWKGGYKAGKQDFKEILAKLERDPKTGKITEKIQIYTHSRGAAFGAGYTTALLEMIAENSDEFADPSSVIDFVYNMAPHQSDFITAPGGVDSYSQDHSRDKLSDNDMKGLKGAFTSNEKSSGVVGAHSTSSFVKDVSGFLKSFKETGGKDSKKLVKSFVNRMKNEYGIEVTVK